MKSQKLVQIVRTVQIRFITHFSAEFYNTVYIVRPFLNAFLRVSVFTFTVGLKIYILKACKFIEHYFITTVILQLSIFNINQWTTTFVLIQ